MHIEGLEFECTCIACPEQYDVFDERNKLVGYVRLRHGLLSCSYPDAFGEMIFDHVFDDPYKGNFYTNEERHEWLIKCAKSINDKITFEALNKAQDQKDR